MRQVACPPNDREISPISPPQSRQANRVEHTDDFADQQITALCESEREKEDAALARRYCGITLYPWWARRKSAFAHPTCAGRVAPRVNHFRLVYTHGLLA